MIRLVLPWPPSENHYRRYVSIGGHRRVLISKAGREYQAAVISRVRASCPINISGRLKVTIHASPPDRRRRDIDNLLKGLLDSLQKAKAIRDDGDIDDLRIVRSPVISGGRLVVEIEEIKEAKP